MATTVSNFLNEGAQIPAGSALKATTTNTAVAPWFNDAAMQVMSNQLDIAAQPYQPYTGPRIAEFSPTEVAGFGMTKAAANAYQPNLNAATAATTGVMNGPGGLNAAQPYLANASGTSVSNIDQYMNPYNDAVTNRIAELGARNLTENIMPGIEGRYIAAGQLGFGGRGGAAGTPSGMMTDTARAIRDVSGNILAEQNNALRAGYSEAAGLAGTDMARNAALASTAGGLAGTDASRTLSAADQLGGLARSEQELGLTGANAVTGVGAAERGMVQRNYDVAQADWEAQQNDPQLKLDKTLNTMNSIRPGVPTSSTDFGIVPLGYQEKTPPSTFSSAVGGGLSVYAAGKDLGLW